MVTATQVTRYAIVGTGGRITMFVDPIVKRFSDTAAIVGFCDVNPARMEYHNQRLQKEHGIDPIPTYLADDFDKMIDETKPDVVIVCTVDAFHAEYAIRTMEKGCDVITEKPMVINDQMCRDLLDTIKRTGRKLRVTFNYRWGPGPTLCRNLIADGTIGDIISVNMEYLLNTSHGADYFRRWHREKDKSGGLMVHKSTHHFDLVNWWIDSVPEEVFGYGRLAFYGRENAEKRGEKVTYDRYTGNATPEQDPFALDLNSSENLINLYRDPEKHDGYQRDRNVFGDNITIEDTMSVLVKYRTGITLNYSLNAFLPREGFLTTINGTKGRIEYQEVHASHIIEGQSDEELAKEMKWETSIVVHPMFGKAYQVDIPTAEGGHGGGDPLIQEQIFSPDAPEEKFNRNAGHGQGAASCLIGIAANQCFKTGKPVKISEMCPQLGDAKRLHELT